jgi:hypothetical protein
MREHKNIRSNVFSCLFLFFLLFNLACKPKTATNIETISFDEKFKSLFYSDYGGISGADGLFSILLPDGSSVFLLGDCFVGKVKEGVRDSNSIMLRNAFNLIDNNKTKAKAIIRGTSDNPLTFMEPVNEKGDSTYRWYWPGHGFVKNDTIYIFALSMVNDSSVALQSGNTASSDNESNEIAETIFSFRISHIDLLSFTFPEFKHIETHKVEVDYPVNQIDFGNCIMIDKGYIYIYGTKNSPGKAKIHIARIPFSNRLFYKDWEYYTGTKWEKNINRSEPLDIDISVSEQFSIFRYKNKYILLTQERAGTDIYSYISDYPNQDFHNKKLIYHTMESESDSTKMILTYNALAHAQYIENDQLLVSYCVNSFRVRDIFDNVEAYRARFLRVPMQLILSETTTR